MQHTRESIKHLMDYLTFIMLSGVSRLFKMMSHHGFLHVILTTSNITI